MQLIHDWNAPSRRTPPPKVALDDETLRDGLQSPSVRNPSIDEKLALLRLMVKLGIQKADLGLPGAGPQHIEHIEVLLRTIVEEKLPIRPGLAVRTVVAEVEPVVRLQQKFGIPIQASAFLGCSRIRKYVEGWTDKVLLERIDETVGFATREGVPCMFVTEDTTRSKPGDLKKVYLRALEKGARALCIADTVGHATPEGTRKIVKFMRKLVRDFDPTLSVELNWHGHSDRGLALANSLAAVEAGINVVHATAIGIGERVGNTPMDLLLVNLKLLGSWEPDLTALKDYVALASRATATPVHHQYPVFGHDAFETATGVHAAAVIKALKKGEAWLADRVYSAVPARDFGMEQKILVGHMSGRSNVSWWLESHGFPVETATVERILAAAKASTRPLTDDELDTLARGGS